jgi:hypothetical protein
MKRPQLKAPEVKPPAFLADLFWDLRDRRLLPLVALVAVAIAAVPFLLGGEAEKVPLTATAEAESAAVEVETEVDSSSLTVVQAKPGLRDYKKRLNRYQKKNPFRQKFTAPVVKGAQLGTETTSGSLGTSSTTATTETGSGSPPSHTPGGAPTGSPSSGRHGELRLFAYVINAKITKQGEKPITKTRVFTQTPLPSEKVPVVTFMGPARTQDNKATGRVLLLVSNEVTSVFGEAKCVSGEDVCQLLEVEPGFPVTFVYGENEVRYTINVLKLDLVVIARKKYSREARMLLP